MDAANLLLTGYSLLTVTQEPLAKAVVPRVERKGLTRLVIPRGKRCAIILSYVVVLVVPGNHPTLDTSMLHLSCGVMRQFHSRLLLCVAVVRKRT